MSSWHSPGSIYNLGHAAVRTLLSGDVQVQEKVDGSFFAFGKFPASKLVDGAWVDDPDGEYELKVRSKGAVMEPSAPMAMFKRATNAVIARESLLKPGWQYRGEVLDKPKHNALAYDRTPKDNVILFDICTSEESYLPYDQLKAEAERIGLEVVPQLYVGKVNEVNDLRKLLKTVSVLGGQLIEGVVIKPLVPQYGMDKKILYGKFVSEAFKEVHRKVWGENNPTSGDIIEQIVQVFATQARWQKALQHLREAGRIEDDPRDIGLLMQEVPADVKKECEDEIKDMLFKHAWPHIGRQVARGLPYWYKELLMSKQFETQMETGAE